MTYDIIDEVPAPYTALTAEDSLFWSPSIAGELHTGPPETLEARTALQALTNLVNAAARSNRVTAQAVSWRKYHVGATAIMVNFTSGSMGYMTGYNVKPQPGQDGLNIHAEQMAVAKGRMVGLSRVIAVNVLADPIDADANPLHRATLLPCGRCTDMFLNTREVDEKTLVLGSNYDYTVCEIYPLKHLFEPTTPTFSNEPFSLKTEADLETYDRVIKLSMLPKIFALHGIS